MAKVGILMGSDSDLPIMGKAAKMLEDFGIEYEMKVISAHREPDIFVDYAKSAEERGIEVIIAGDSAGIWQICLLRSYRRDEKRKREGIRRRFRIRVLKCFITV